MKKFLVGVFATFVVFLAIHYKVVTVNFELLLMYTWPIIRWTTGILGGALIGFALRSSAKNSP